jgi:hypothetical protein
MLQEDFLMEDTFTFELHNSDRTTAILEIQVFTKNRRQLRDIESKAITMLRLFKPASVMALSADIKTDCFWERAGGGGTTRRDTIFFSPLIENDEKDKLSNFFLEMSKKLPEEGYSSHSKIFTPIENAYQRYSESMFTLDVSIERRIADAVMGLESLFLRENQEVSYRLRIRAAKVLGILGYDPYKTKEIVNYAYAVRSSFVHGDKVSDSNRKSILKRYENFENLYKMVIEQLRIAIVVYVMIELNKNELIELIDDSFIDSQKVSDLESHLKTITPFTNDYIQINNA